MFQPAVASNLPLRNRKLPDISKTTSTKKLEKSTFFIKKEIESDAFTKTVNSIEHPFDTHTMVKRIT
ncbi:hypothetical protein KSF78_0008983 [Schistosoma japonicum]|nr:hypothetical protein KSF78_0008983 [Schistosoma japonicum]KAH8858705.1 hypothetical protein KSF78_0008983 [Schistosoma japonicum]